MSEVEELIGRLRPSFVEDESVDAAIRDLRPDKPRTAESLSNYLGAVNALRSDAAAALEQMKAELATTTAKLNHEAALSDKRALERDRAEARIAELESSLASAVAAEREALDDLTEFIWAGDWDAPEMPPSLANKTPIYVWGYAQADTLMALIAAIRSRSEGGKRP